MSLTPFQNRFLSRQALGIGLVGWLLPLGLFGLGGCLAKGADQQAAVSLTGSWKWYSRTFKYQ
jgi:hypothetical protein